MATATATGTKKEETQAEKFKRLTNKRVNKVLNSIRTLNSLAAYDPTKEQTEKVFQACQTALKTAYQAWLEKKAPKVDSFSV